MSFGCPDWGVDLDLGHGCPKPVLSPGYAGEAGGLGGYGYGFGSKRFVSIAEIKFADA